MRQGPNGFTIIETLVAALVLSTGVLALVGGVRTATQVARKARELDSLGVLAANEIEVLRNRGCGAVAGSRRAGRWEIEWSTRRRSGAVAEATVTVRSVTGGTVRADTFAATLGC